MTYRTYHSRFDQQQYDKSETKFYALPAKWGAEDERPVLADLYRAGASGIFAILPVFGWLAGLKAGREGWHFSIEQLARLTRTDQKTVRKAYRALAEKQFVSTSLGQRHGKRLTRWSVSPHLSACGTDDKSEDYFYLRLRIVHGANWAALSPGQRGLYLGAATLAYAFNGSLEENRLLTDVLAEDADCFDLLRAYHYQESSSETITKGVRLACASARELSRITGMSESMIADAVRGLKHPRLFPDSCNDPYALEYAPLWVYPVRPGHSLLFHFRDHVPHIPWAVANTRGWRGLGGLAKQLIPSASDADVDLPTVYNSNAGVLDSDWARWEEETYDVRG